MTALVEVSGLRVTAASPGGAESDIVRDISFSIARGEVLALIGESGSGKTTIALTLLGYARRGCRIAGGSVRIGDDEVTSLSSGALSDLRGRRVAYVAQSAAAAFNPSLRLMDQVTEGVRMRGLMPRGAAEAKAREIFRALALPEPDRIGARFPHQVSGGQLQRLMAAMALMTDPELVIFDEPTTALDVTTQVEVLRAFREAVRERHTTAVYVSHDLAVVAQIADRIVVLRDGTMREIGPTQQILAQPADNYTKSLLAAASPKPREAGDARLIGADLSALLPSFAGEVSPSYGDGGVMSPSPVAHDPSVREDADTSPAGLGRRAQKLAPMGARHPSRVFVDSGADRATSAAGAPPPVARPQPPLLEVRGLTAGYGPIDREGRVATPVLHDISLEISAGSALGVIGESGSGKSTLARVIAGLLPAASGSMTLDGVALAPMLEARGREELRRIQIVFQAADTALNPAHSVERILSRPLAFYHRLSRSEQRRRVRRLLDLVKLPVALLDRLPNELSGGQKQRVNLARALAAEPALILCDEVTSSLDTVVGAAILELLAELRRELGLALMFISHDLATVRAVCDEVMILYAGQVMERGPGRVVMQAPQHPYADLLASSMPELRPGWLDGIDAARLAEARGEAARPSHSDRCAFVARCATRNALCDTDPPPLRRFAKGSDVRCHRTEQELLAQQSARPDGAVVVPLQRLNHRA